MKKLLALTIAALMMLTLLVSCTSDAPAESTAPADTSEAGDAAEGDAAVSEGYTMPFAEPQTVKILTAESYSGASLPETGVWQDFEEQTNVTIEWDLIVASDYPQVAAVRLSAGTDLGDIARLPNMDTDSKYQESGLFIPLNDLMAQYGVEIPRVFEERPDIKAQLSNGDGEVYFISDRYMPTTVQRHIILNYDWLEALDAEVPTTTDEFYDLLVRFRDEDPNGNGEADEIPLTTTMDNIHGVMAPAFDLDLESGFTVSEDGSVHSSYTDPKLLDYLEYMNMLYSEKLLDQELPTKTMELIDSNVAADKAGSVLSWSWHMMTFSQLVEGYVLSDEEAGRWRGIMPLEGPDGFKQLYTRPELGSQFGITAESEQPEVAYKVLDYFYNQDRIDTNNWGVEGVNWEMVDGEKQATEAHKTDPEVDRVSGRGHGPIVWQDSDTSYALLAQWHVDIDMELQDYFAPSFPFVYGTADETDALSDFSTEMQVFAKEKILAFITGSESLDGFDAYVAELEAMGINDVLAVKQAQYDRYLSNL